MDKKSFNLENETREENYMIWKILRFKTSQPRKKLREVNLEY